MAIEWHENCRGQQVATLVDCPACGESLTTYEVKGHVADHSPEDFGLSPIGERPDTGPLRFDHPLIEG